MPMAIAYLNHDSDEGDEDFSRRDSDEMIVADDDSDSADMIELESPEDFASHFEERDGRLFHSHGSSLPYPLPVDASEQARFNSQHDTIRNAIGANYVGPVHEVLARRDGGTIRVIDLCTGTGKWVVEMAQQFPHAIFRGIDIVPIVTRYPSRNVQFELHDVNEPCRWRDGSVDMIHARDIKLAVFSYSRLLEDVARMLRPGGLFLSGEWGHYVMLHPEFRGMTAHIPNTSHFYNILNAALVQNQHIYPRGDQVSDWVRNSGYFTSTSIIRQEYYFPVGDWAPDQEHMHAGLDLLDMARKYANALKPVLREAGHSSEYLDGLISRYLEELCSVRGLVFVFHTVHARRI